MSEPGKGLRSEPTVEARVQRLWTAAVDPDQAKTLPRMKLLDPQWKSDWSFLLMVAPEAAGDYLRATMTDAPHVYDDMQRLLRSADTLKSVDALDVLLNYAQRHADNTYEFAGVLAGCAKAVIHRLADEQVKDEGWLALDMMRERYNLFQRTDIFLSGKNITHLVVDVLLDVEVEWVANMKAAYKNGEPSPLFMLADELFERIQRGGGDLNHQCRVRCWGASEPDTTQVASPLLVTAQAFERGKHGNYLIVALINQGADWKSVIDHVQEGAREEILDHPRVKSERLMEEALTRTSGSKPGGMKL